MSILKTLEQFLIDFFTNPKRVSNLNLKLKFDQAHQANNSKGYESLKQKRRGA